MVVLDGAVAVAAGFLTVVVVIIFLVAAAEEATVAFFVTAGVFMVVVVAAGFVAVDAHLAQSPPIEGCFLPLSASICKLLGDIVLLWQLSQLCPSCPLDQRRSFGLLLSQLSVRRRH